MPNSELKTVLIFAYECEPYNQAGSAAAGQRPAQFAKHLPQYGWRAVVLCCDARRRGVTPAAGWLDEIRATVSQAAPDKSLIIPTPALPADGLVDYCWRALTTDDISDRPLRRLLRQPLTVAQKFTGDYSRPWRPCAGQAAEIIAETIKVGVCIGGHSPDAGLFLAREFSRKRRVPWLADFRDPVLKGHPPLVQKIYQPYLKHLLKSASGLINVSTRLAGIDRKMFARRTWAISNGFDPDEFREAAAGPDNGKFTVAYTGSVHDAHRLETFLEGLARLQKKYDGLGQVFSFVYRGYAVEKVQRLAAQCGVSELVDAAGHIPRSASLGLLKGADVLLLLSVAQPEQEDIYYRKGVHPTKAFEYFGAGRPILCVPGDKGLLDKLLKKTRAGVSLSAPAVIADYLAQGLALRRESRRLPYEPVLTEINRFTRNALAGKLAAILDGLAK